MASTRLTFVLDGRDGLTPVMRRAGESAEDFRRRLRRAAGDANADLTAFTRDADGRLRDLSGQFLTTADAAGVTGRSITQTRRSTADWSGVADRASDVGAKLTASLMSLAPAAIPAAASLVPLAAGAGAVGVAVLAFTGALIPQISALSEAAEAEKKYDQAVTKSGRTSEQAITAQLAYQKAMADLPPETRKAAVALGLLKDAGKAWSDSLAGDTMPVFTKGLAIANELLPKTTGLVKGTSAQLDRMMTVIGGSMMSPGLDRLNSKFTAFATGTLRKVNDALVHFMRTSDGKIGGGLAEFMGYASAQGPVVADTIRNVGEALGNLLVGASEVGVSMLDIVNGLSGIVAAVPPGAVSTILQLVVAIKLAKLAAVGMAAGRAAMAAFTAEIVAMRAAAAAAPGRLAGVTAGIGAMSRTARIAAAGAGIGLLVIGLMELQKMGKDTPPDIDKMTSSLGQFADSGKVAGEAARVFGKDLGDLMASLALLSATKDSDDFFKGFKDHPVSFSKAKEEVEALDKSLAGLVQGGKADLAAAALARIRGKMGEAGYATSGLKTKLTEYKSALADAAFEQELAAQAMGLFGAQAQQVQSKLDAQKASADGLRQSIQALNDVNRQGLGGMIGFEAAIDAASKAARDNAGALDMSGGKLNLNSEKARNAATALNDLASKTDEATASARESGASWSTVNGIYSRGRQKLLESAQAMGLTKSEARKLADQILKTPDKTAKLKGNLEDLAAKLADAKKRLAAAPSSKTAKIKGEISDLQAKIGQAKYALSQVHNKTVSVMVQYRTSKSGASEFAKSIGGYASGGRPRPGEVAWVGEEGPELLEFGPGGARVYSHSESKALVADASRAGRDAGAGLRSGMGVSTGAVTAGGRGLGAAVLAGIRDELQIASPSKKTRALAADAGKGMLIGLTGSKAKISEVARDLVKDIWAAWKGTKSTKDSKLVAMVNRDTKKLQALASKRDALASKIATAKKYATDTTASARQESSLGQLGIEEGGVTAGSIQAGLAAKLSKLKTFTSYIGMLAKRGLSKGLIRQILDMGPEQGYAYASALAGASASTLKSINKTQAGIDSASTTLGRNGADILYDSGKQAGKGFLKGLESQQDAIEAQMLKIAKAMQKAIKKALGIKSPSTVMAQLGRYSTEGFARGLVQPMPMIDAALGQLSGRVAGTRPVIGRPAGVGSGGGTYVTVNVDARGAMDPVAVAREVEKIQLRYSRAQGKR